MLASRAPSYIHIDNFVLLSPLSQCLVVIKAADMPWPNPFNGDPAKVYKMFGPRLNLINSLRHFAHASPKFHSASKSAKFCLNFRHQSPLKQCSFEMEQYVGNLILRA